jgi:hypothetical protein
VWLKVAFVSRIIVVFGGEKSANTHLMIFHWFVYLFRDTLLTKAQAKELNVADPEHHWRKILAVGVDDFRGLWGLPPLHLARIEAMSEIACCHVVWFLVDRNCGYRSV